MKILHVISSLSPRSGGPTTTLRALAKYQAQAGLDVTVCTTNSDGPTGGKMPVPVNSAIVEDGVTYWYFPYWTPILLAPSLQKWLMKHLGEFDLVDIHGLYRFPVTYSAWLARKVGIPYIIRPHGSLDPFMYKQSRYSLPLKRLYEWKFELPNLNHAAAIHYTAKEEKERAEFLGLRAKPIVVPGGIDWESYKNLPTKGAFRRSLGLNDQVPLVLFLGRINFKKGLDLLIPAFARVVEEFSSARLAIVGPDNEGYGSKVRRWCAESGIQDKVFFIDILGPEEVKQAYVDANVFVLPSYTENFGLTVVEAMASGCPVVISDQVNIWREIQDEGAGFVVSLAPSEIAEAICHLLEYKNEAEAMAGRGRLAAEKRYSWLPIVEQLTTVYREVIEENTGKLLLGK